MALQCAMEAFSNPETRTCEHIESRIWRLGRLGFNMFQDRVSLALHTLQFIAVVCEILSAHVYIALVLCVIAFLASKFSW